VARGHSTAHGCTYNKLLHWNDGNLRFFKTKRLTPIHAYLHTLTQKHICTHVRSHTRMSAQFDTHTRTHTATHTHMNTHRHTQGHASAHLPGGQQAPAALLSAAPQKVLQAGSSSSMLRPCKQQALQELTLGFRAPPEKAIGENRCIGGFNPPVPDGFFAHC